jgi:hypothetical protein
MDAANHPRLEGHVLSKAICDIVKMDYVDNMGAVQQHGINKGICAVVRRNR